MKMIRTECREWLPERHQALVEVLGHNINQNYIKIIVFFYISDIKLQGEYGPHLFVIFVVDANVRLALEP